MIDSTINSQIAHLRNSGKSEEADRLEKRLNTLEYLHDDIVKADALLKRLQQLGLQKYALRLTHNCRLTCTQPHCCMLADSCKCTHEYTLTVALCVATQAADTGARNAASTTRGGALLGWRLQEHVWDLTRHLGGR